MDFIDEIRAFAKNIPSLSEKILTEEGTKNALIMPFIRIMGYDVFNPNEVNPEFVADVGTKKGEKVDYALLIDGKLVALVECKPVSTDLGKEHASQLYRYFTTTSTRVGILTNGVIYQFFTDLDTPNTMDNKPFLEINLLDIKEPLIEELKKFTKTGFNIDELDDTASQLRYTREIKQILNAEFNQPSDEFIRFFGTQVYPKKLTEKARERFGKITKEAVNQFLNEKINDRLKSAMESETTNLQVIKQTEEIGSSSESLEDGAITTEDEYQSYYMVKAILREIIDPSRVVIRDAKTYCAILLDDNNRRPICRFYYNTKQKYISTFEKEDKSETKIAITDLNEIYNLTDAIKKTVQNYDSS